MAIILPTLALLMQNKKNTKQLLDTNPMSLILTPTAQWMGMTNIVAVAADGNKHVTFASADFGLRAGCIALYANCQRGEISTLEALLKRWTPHNDSLFSHGGYYERTFGLRLKDPVPWNHISQMAEIVRAIVRLERGSDYVERHEKMLTVGIRAYLFKGAFRHCPDMTLELSATSRVMQYVNYLTKTGRAYPGKTARREAALTVARQSDQPSERVVLFTLALVEPTNKLMTDEYVRIYIPKEVFRLVTSPTPKEHTVPAYTNYWASAVSSSKLQGFRDVLSRVPPRLLAGLPHSDGSSYEARRAREQVESEEFKLSGAMPPRMGEVALESVGQPQPWKAYDRLAGASPMFLI
jgi:hypothetical protein